MVSQPPFNKQDARLRGIVLGAIYIFLFLQKLIVDKPQPQVFFLFLYLIFYLAFWYLPVSILGMGNNYLLLCSYSVEN